MLLTPRQNTSWASQITWSHQGWSYTEPAEHYGFSCSGGSWSQDQRRPWNQLLWTVYKPERQNKEKKNVKNHTSRLNLTMQLGTATLALLAYSSQEGLTGTNITWRGESHSGLVEEGPQNKFYTKILPFLTVKQNTKKSLPAKIYYAKEKKMHEPPSLGAHNTVAHRTWVILSNAFSESDQCSCLINTSPFPCIVLREDGNHPLHGAQDGTVDDDWSGSVVAILPVKH